MKKCSIKYNLVTEFPMYAREWNYEKNIGLSPYDFAPKSAKKVYWKCNFNPNATQVLITLPVF